MNWTEGELKKRLEAGKIRGYTGQGQPKKKKIPKVPEGLQHIINVLTFHKIPFIHEYKFHPDRKFRFDVAILHLKIGCEYEGLMSRKSRHTTVTGYSKDASKYNLAQSMGWKVMRYTALNFRDFEKDILSLMKNNSPAL